MKRPAIDYWMRLASKDNPKNTKRLKDQIEYWRVMRGADREMEQIMMPIIKWIDRQIKRFSR